MISHIRFEFYVMNVICMYFKDPNNLPGEDKMKQEGVCQFLQDLHFNLEDKVVLVLAWKFKAQVQGEFTKEEFYNAMTELG